MQNVENITVGNGSKFIAKEGITGTSANNKFTWGKKSEVTIGNVDLEAGNNSFIVGADSEVTILQDLVNVSTVKVDKATTMIVGGSLTGDKLNVTVGDASKLDVVTGNIQISKFGTIGDRGYIGQTVVC